MSVSRQRALTLYRNILRAHREKLPYHLRELGDTYVRYVRKSLKTREREDLYMLKREISKFSLTVVPCVLRLILFFIGKNLNVIKRRTQNGYNPSLRNGISI
jgi:hypothetical protein